MNAFFSKNLIFWVTVLWKSKSTPMELKGIYIVINITKCVKLVKTHYHISKWSETYWDFNRTQNFQFYSKLSSALGQTIRPHHITKFASTIMLYKILQYAMRELVFIIKYIESDSLGHNGTYKCVISCPEHIRATLWMLAHAYCLITWWAALCWQWPSGSA